ncbi:MarR family transcriptional regulator [Cytobacillus oceanisediminis]
MTYAKDMPTDSQNLALAVARLNRRLRQERHSDLTPTQMSVLGTLRQMGPTSPSSIAARERVSAPSVTRTLNCLAEDGLVERAPHPQDGRQVVVSLSDLGEKTLAEERKRRDAWLHQRLTSLDARERAVLREAAAILTRITDS